MKRRRGLLGLVTLIAVAFASELSAQERDQGHPYPACPIGYSPSQLVDIFERAAFGSDKEMDFRNKIMPVGHEATRVYGDSASNPFYTRARDAAFYLFNLGHYGWFSSKKIIDSSVSYSGFVIDTKKQGMPSNESFVAGVPRDKIDNISSAEKDEYECIYDVVEREVRGQRVIKIGTIHRLPTERYDLGSEYSKAWTCVQRSFLYYLGYASVDAIHDSELVLEIENGNKYEPTQIYGWLVKLALDGEVYLSHADPVGTLNRLRNHLNARCK